MQRKKLKNIDLDNYVGTVDDPTPLQESPWAAVLNELKAVPPLISDGWVTRKHLQDLWGCSRSVTRGRLDKLEDMGRVEITKVGGTKYYRLK